MMKLVIVGGFGRAGTNTVSLFLHLHNEVFGFVSGDKTQFDRDLNYYIRVQVPQITRYGQYRSTLSDPKLLAEMDKLTEFIENKNKLFPESIFKFPCIVRKHEKVEWDELERLRFFESLSSLTLPQVDLKFIFCVRKSFRDLYLSRTAGRKNGEKETPEEFLGMCKMSFAQIRKLSERYDCVCIDVTDEHRFEHDYLSVNRMLGLEISEWQKWWIKNNPKTNAATLSVLKDRESFHVPAILAEEYSNEFWRTKDGNL